MAIIQNHRKLRDSINEHPWIASEERSLRESANAKICFNGVAIDKIRVGKDNKLIFDVVFDDISKANLHEEHRIHYREFLRRYLHLDGIQQISTIPVLSQLQKHGYLIRGSRVTCTTDFYLENNDFYIEEKFSIALDRLISNPDPVLQVDKDLSGVEKEYERFIYGKTQFKIQMTKQNELRVLQLILLQSTLDCPDPSFKKLLDERSFLQKLIDFIRRIFRISISTPIRTFNTFNFFNLTSEQAPLSGQTGQMDLSTSTVSPCPS
ncbi:MAG: hypothetical protein V4700_04585 [Pseudomonadota bacterium]